MKRNRLIVLIICIIVIVLLIGFFIRNNYQNKNDKMNDLKISYSDGKDIKFNSFTNNFTEERTITVENISKENKTYSLEWTDINNTLSKQNNFTYEIKCSGSRCAELGKSQVPVASSVVYQQVLIEPSKKQEYKIIFTYNGSEKKANFKGKLKVYSEVIDKKKIEKQERKEETKLDA